MKGGGRRMLTFVSAALVVLLISSCASKIVFGTPANTDALTSLQLGSSTAQDVERVLGQPRGRGRAQLPMMDQARTMWVYEHTEAEGMRMHLKMLFVFLDNDRYDGHL